MLHMFFQVEIEVGSWARTLHTSPGASLSSLPWNFKPGIACQYLFPYSGRQKSGFEIFVFLVPVAVDELAVGSRAGAPVLEVVAENNLLLLFLKKNKLKSDPNIAMILLFTICQWMECYATHLGLWGESTKLSKFIAPDLNYCALASPT